jgi:exopolysaccharide production protein ExoY
VEASRAVVTSRPGGLRYARGRLLKRTFDVATSLLLLPVAVPLMVLIAVLIKLTSRGPVFFRHERVGRGGQMFRLIKFRTMRVDAVARLHSDPNLYAEYVRNDFKLPNHSDPRVFSFGRALRRSSLDELPQLFNVLAGTMSLVGPRPVVVAELDRYGSLAWAYLELRPGITGRWQTDGRNDIRYPERAELDAEYLLNWRFRLDLSIVARTVPSVIRRRGTH